MVRTNVWSLTFVKVTIACVDNPGGVGFVQNTLPRTIDLYDDDKWDLPSVGSPSDPANRCMDKARNVAPPPTAIR